MPVTAGGASGGMSNSVNFSGGEFVFGFFLDGEDSQQPIVMGIFDKSAQINQSKSIPEVGFTPFSGYTNGLVESLNNVKEKGTIKKSATSGTVSRSNGVSTNKTLADESVVNESQSTDVKDQGDKAAHENAKITGEVKPANKCADDNPAAGIKLAMDFVMNNQGSTSWVAATNSLKNSAEAQRAYETNKFEFTEEVLKDYRDELIAGAETRKGAPLTAKEKSIIFAGIDEDVEEFDSSTLTPGTTEFLNYDPLTGETILVPAVEAEEPDFEEFSEQGADILEQIFAPRESLAEASDREDDTFVRMQRNLRGLSAAENKRTGRP